MSPGAAIAGALPRARAVLARCDTLAALSARPDAICRVYLSAEHRAANELVGTWMGEAGMDVWQDAAGSICGRYPAATEALARDAAADPWPVLVIGSHLDTVPDAGRYDGTLGVLLGISAIESLSRRGVRLPFHVDVVGFGEEEGVRFATTLISSRAFAGTFEPAWLDLRDGEGVTLAEALVRFGLDPGALPRASRAGQDLMGYLEVHIEQGPVLEQRGLPLGVVSAIAGTRRLRLRVTGQAGHAGTTPMDLRRDALAGAALGITALERVAHDHGVVATVGRIACTPGAVNVIPGSAEFSVDIRCGDDARRDAALEAFLQGFRATCETRELELDVAETHAAGAVQCSLWLRQALAETVAALGSEPVELESGAGHDAMAVAAVCDVGMLFLRCAGGISHHPAEAVSAEDVAWALLALERTIERIADSVGGHAGGKAGGNRES